MTSTALALRENNIDQYMREVKRNPLLTVEEEQHLARAYRDEGDLAAAHRLVIGNLRFVVKIAHEYRHYGFKMLDLVQEGNVGLMLAVKKFDPDRGYRLISYAVWWIRAQIQSFVQRSWSMVKIGMNSARRKLFFKIRSERSKADRELGPGETATAQQLAERLGVTEAQVNEMEIMMAGRDFSLDAHLSNDGQTSHLDMLESSGPSQADALEELEETRMLRASLDEIKSSSNDKERYIIEHRLLDDDPESLQEIGTRFGVSRERIRQLESRVLKKLKTSLEEQNHPRSRSAESSAWASMA